MGVSMARAVKGFRYADYLALHAQTAEDVERMSPRAMKSYLQFRLHLVEAEIQYLSNKLGVNSDRVATRKRRPKEAMAHPQWASLADLDYLLAARDALRQTIDTL
jgi:hypothetical protein